MNSQELVNALHNAFGYTEDNNRDLIADTLFPLADVIEELKVHEAYNFLIAYIHRHVEMIDTNLTIADEEQDIINLNNEGKEAL